MMDPNVVDDYGSCSSCMHSSKKVDEKEECKQSTSRGSFRLDDPEFTTKFALLLTVTTCVLLAVLSLVYGEKEPDPTGGTMSRHRWLSQEPQVEDGSDGGNGLGGGEGEGDTDYSKYSCHYFYDKTPYPGKEQCQFARTCNGGTGIWAPFVYCSEHFSSAVLATIISPAMLLWLVLLFRMLGSTAEDYFSPALEMFSVKLGLPPRFAGVTLLALGNGAADVSATVSAITSDPERGYELSLGALTGAAMFISAVISAAVVLAADGVQCRGALVRDVIMLLITVVTVWYQLGKGTVGPDTMTLFLTLYFCFVLLVLVADIYHRAVVVPRLAAYNLEQERLRQLQDAAQIEQEFPPLNSQQSSMREQPPAMPAGRLAQVITALSNYDNPNLNNNNNGGLGVESDDLAHERPIVLRGRDGVLRDTAHHHPGGDPSSPMNPDSGSYLMLGDTAMDGITPSGGELARAHNWAEAVVVCQKELSAHAGDVWDDIVWNGDISTLTKFLLLAELPFTVLRKLTVPIPCEDYYVRSLVALSMVLSPLWFAYYLWDGHDYNVFSDGGWKYAVVVWGASIVVGLSLIRFAPPTNNTTNNTTALALPISAPIALYGFVLAATWIDTIANALVSLLNFIGIILRIPGPIIGLTILAWGNSMSDLTADVTMARKGLGNMAITACFAGPVFNILVGLGLGFGGLAAKTGQVETPVSLSPSVVTGFVFLMVNTALILTTGLLLNAGRIEKTYGYSALSIYTIYVITSIVLQYKNGGSDS